MSTLARRLVPLMLMFVTSAAEAQTSWWSADLSLSFRGTSGLVEVAVLTVDLAAASMRVLSVPFEMRSHLGQVEGSVSLRELAGRLASDPRYKGKEWIAVNGGFSSYRVDVPLGLLVVDGKVYSRINSSEVRRGSACRQSDYGTFRWSGVLCNRKDTRTWDIISPATYTAGLCEQAIQAGPVLVEPDSTVGICPSEPTLTQSFARTAICLAGDGRMKVVTTKATHLLPLAQWLSTPASAGGLGCRVAVNLSGDTSSAIALRSPATGPIRYFGEGSYPIPSALIIQGRQGRTGSKPPQ